MSFDIVTAVTSGPVANGGTITLNYPANRDAGAYSPVGHVARARGLMSDLALNSGFNLTFGTSNITFTYRGTTPIPAASVVTVQMNRFGVDGKVQDQALNAMPRVQMKAPIEINLGAPDAAVANGVCASQTINTTATINGGLAAGGVATFDVPRNVVAAWTNTATITITGTDEYGVVITETSASGTSHAGKKAFKTVTSVVSSTSITSATVGTGDVLGLPVFIPGTASIIRELQDGAAATAGTTVAGVTATATATTGDVRGTYDPNAACNGALAFQLFALVDDPTFRGVTQA